MKRLFSVAAALAIATAAEAGEATRVASTPAFAIRGYHFVTSTFTQAPEGSGTVHPQAVVAKFANAPVVFSVAIDTADPSARLPEVVRFDFAGSGNYAKAASLPFREVTEDPSGVACAIGPDTLRVTVGGKEIPVSVRGSYWRPVDGPRRLTLDLCTAIQAKVSFGETSHEVQVVDADGNLRPGDKVQPLIRGSGVAGMTGGDTLIVDLSDGSFSGNLLVGFYGQPIRLDDGWYDVSLSEDGSRITAKKLDISSGKLRIANDNWEGVFISDKYVMVYFDVAAGQPVDIPVGRYAVKRYRQRFGTGERPRGRVVVETPSRNEGPFLLSGRELSFAVPVGRIVDVSIGAPLTVTAAATKGEGGTYALSAKITDASGSENVWVNNPEGDSPDVFIRILDAAGNEVDKVKLDYVRWVGYSRTWTVPSGLRGRLTFVPVYDVPPLKVDLVKTTVQTD